MIKNFLLLTCFVFSVSNNLFAQQLHHQMISSQGVSTTTSSGLIVKQTIGQQSVSGNSKGDIIVQQGFQQSYWQELINNISNSAGIMMLTYPNPFREVLNFKLSNFSGTSVHVSIFDSYGRSVFEKTSTVNDNLITLEDMSILPSAQYLVRLSDNQINYYTTVIKI